MYDFVQAYADACSTHSDVHEHLPTLNALATNCEHVTEFGVRWATSSKAFLCLPVTYRGYDIQLFPEAETVFAHAAAQNKDARLIIQDTLSLTLDTFEQTDLLFIDSLHNYAQVSAELCLSPNVRRYICLHDTELFGQTGQDGSRGIWPAIVEFVAANNNWHIKEHYTNNNGMTVLERIHP